MAKGNFQRVAKKYHWDYQSAELVLADAMAELSVLKRTVDRLSSDIDGLLKQPETPFDVRQQFSASHQITLHNLVRALEAQRSTYRQAYFAQSGRIVTLRKELMLAKVRRDKSRERQRAAIVADHKSRLDAEMLDIADRLNAKPINRSSVEPISLKRAAPNRRNDMEAQGSGY